MKYNFLVMTNPVEGREEEYNNWYSNTHLPEVLQIPGIVAAQRFCVTEAQRPTSTQSPEWRYCAVYEFDTDDLPGLLKELVTRSPNMVRSSALHEKRTAFVYEAITPRLEELPNKQ